MNSVIFTIVPVFIAIVALFVFGGIITTFIMAVRHRGAIQQVTDEALRQSRRQRSPEWPRRAAGSASAADYACEHCGASLGANTEISPSGDFKCEYCDSWSSIRS